MNKLKKRLLTLFTFVMISSFAMAGSASAVSGDGGMSYWFYDGSGCCSMLYFAPAGGGEHVFTGMYQDSNGEVFYYAVQ